MDLDDIIPHGVHYRVLMRLVDKSYSCTCMGWLGWVCPASWVGTMNATKHEESLSGRCDWSCVVVDVFGGR